MTLEVSPGVCPPQEFVKSSPSEPLVFRNLPLCNTHSAAQESQDVGVSAAEMVDHDSIIRMALEQGRSEGRAAAEQMLQEQIRLEKASVLRLVEQFEQEKQRYFSDVEREVVKLSLAIAERVLRRESEMDPTLLAAAARVALEQVADGSDAVLRVSAEEVDRWHEAFQPTGKKMLIEADADMQRGECMLRTRSGTMQLGMRAQLQEIERGFFELLGRRPASAVASC